RKMLERGERVHEVDRFRCDGNRFRVAVDELAAGTHSWIESAHREIEANGGYAPSGQLGDHHPVPATELERTPDPVQVDRGDQLIDLLASSLDKARRVISNDVGRAVAALHQ